MRTAAIAATFAAPSAAMAAAEVATYTCGDDCGAACVFRAVAFFLGWPSTPVRVLLRLCGWACLDWPFSPESRCFLLKQVI
ncbi:hypothetical protein L596_026746 [Steinernema carpocapsae]|uniref:Secreted protein n=1 Tax=Steinernema carpocapsae TaxID=34508 RepID=A0A4U5M2B5_STECR|nr:hypothetical protein L596_026746 [Steinernema carpocapsae]